MYRRVHRSLVAGSSEREHVGSKALRYDAVTTLYTWHRYTIASDIQQQFHTLLRQQAIWRQRRHYRPERL